MSAAGDDCLDIAVALEDPGWATAEREAASLCRRAAMAALRGAGYSGPGELAILLTDDRRVAALNDRWRGQSGATNVLAFATGETATGGAPRLLGDVVVARETVTAEALDQGKPLAAHLAHMVVHGTLHLLGFDHRSSGEAARMEALEARVLAGLGIADPYGEEAAKP